MTDGKRQRLSGFRLLDADGPVGEGGQGTVRRAVCERSDFPGLFVGTTVALKIIPAADADEASWRRRKAMVAALMALGSPNVVRHYGCFRVREGESPLHVVVMEYLPEMPGRTLRDVLHAAKGRGLPYGDVIAAFVRYAQALSALHLRGIVHRDVKPANLYYPSGDMAKAALLDFGVALEEGAAKSEELAPGTPDYMSPEMLIGTSHGSPASDIYALGCCLYEALTGQPAFPRFKRGAKSGALEPYVIRARQMRAPEFGSSLVAANPDLERLLRRMTEPDVARRMSNVAEAEMDLQTLLDAFERGDWQPPHIDFETTGGGSDDLSSDATRTSEEPPPQQNLPVPFWRRLVRNRRELLLILALLVELASTAVIIWQRPRSIAIEAERRVLAERLKAAEEARAHAERKAAAAAAEAKRIRAEHRGERGL